MTLRPGLFVSGPSGGIVQPQDARLALAGLLSGPGLLAGGAVAGSSSGPNMKYTVAAGVFVTARGSASADGLYVFANDGSVLLDSGAPAPGSGTRWDLIWVRAKNGFDGGFGDADSLPEAGVTVGTASSTPSKPYSSVPAGALVLAEASVGTSITSAAAASISQVAPDARGDTGYVDLALSGGVTAVVLGLAYRADSHAVYIEGDFKGTSSFPANSGPYSLLATPLPVGLRPSRTISREVIGTNGAGGLIQVGTDGTLKYTNGPNVAGNVLVGFSYKPG